MILPFSPAPLPRDTGLAVLVAGTPVLDPQQPINQVGATLILLWAGCAALDTPSPALQRFWVARKTRGN